MRTFLLISLTFFGSLALARGAYDIRFTGDEVALHMEKSQTQTEIAAQCLDRTYDEHLEFFTKYKVSKFYGDRRAAHKTRAGRIQELVRFGASKNLIDELEPISCIGLTMRCMRESFLATGQDSAWAKIAQQMNPNMLGTDLQILLQKLGWQLMYWNPDPDSNERWDKQDQELTPLRVGREWMPVWGGHEARYNSVMRNGRYFNLNIDEAEMLVGFGSVQPLEFTEIPLFVGTAHAGYHVFPGRRGEVIEAHSTRKLNAIDNLEFSPFNPLAPGGGPRWTNTEKYRSGVIAVPPGTLN